MLNLTGDTIEINPEVTHPHPDHIEGLFSVIQKYEIDSIIANENISESKNYTFF